MTLHPYPNAIPQFITLIGQAKLAAIGGVLPRKCHNGLVRRGVSWGFSPDMAAAFIKSTQPARRAPRTTDQWK